MFILTLPIMRYKCERVTMLSVVLFCCLYAIALCEDMQWRSVQLAQGLVRGYKDPDEEIFSFYGIPYAKAPTGTDRFKAPLPAPVWADTFEAIDKEIVCPQSNLLNILPSSKVKKEDCLIANIYVPDTNKTNLPVLVIVHGGAYAIGWGNMFTPKKITSSKKVISVTFNYRLGAHGFLCLGTKDVPGNAGFKDQVALIRWVRNNIIHFGGNPEDIIISGFSSGAAAVDVLVLSKITKGLFKKVIPESSSGLSPFSVQLDPIENAKKYAKLLQFDNVEDLEALEKFYKTIPYELLNSVNTMVRRNSETIMAACIERDIGEEIFLDDSPMNILKSGNFEKLPTLYGFANMDGLFRLPLFPNFRDAMNDKFSDFLPVDLQFKSENEKEAVTEEIRHFYFGDKLVGEATVLAYVDYFTDVMFAIPMLRFVKLQVEAGHRQIYLYEYSYFEDSTPYVPYTNVRGANHCAQTFGALDGFWNDTIVDEIDVSVDIKQRKIFMKEIWLHFMLTGTPIPEGSVLPAWPPVSFDWSPHMSINRTLELKGSALKERSLFWEHIYDKYYRYPVPPMLPTSRH